jgi:WD40 repeat protein
LNREAGAHAQAVKNLYHSLVREAQAIRRVRDNGYRQEVWNRLKQALALETPEKDLGELRQEAVACLGDFVGLAPTTWTDFTSGIRALEVHPDGWHVVIGLNDGTILVRDLATGADSARLHGHLAPVLRLSFDAAGNRMASADLAGKVKIWQARSASNWVCDRTFAIAPPKRATFLHGSSILVALSADGKSLVTHSSPQPAIELWCLTDGARTATFALPGPGRLEGLVFSPDGKRLAAGYTSAQDYRLLVWDFAQRAFQHNIPSDHGLIFGVSFSSNGNYLAYAANEGFAVLDGSSFQRLNFARHGLCSSIRFSPDDRLVAFAEPLFGMIHVWEIATNREVAVLSLPGSWIVRFSKDGQTLLSAAGRAVRIWNQTAAREKLVVRAHVGEVSSVAFSPDGTLLASAGKDRTVRIWDPATGRLVHELTGFRGGLEQIAFSPDGSLLATGDWARGIRFWQLPTWQELPAPQHPLGPVIWDCAFSPDGRSFAACGEGGLVIWKVCPHPAGARPNTRPLVQQPVRPLERLTTSLKFSPDGNLLAYCTRDDYALHLWDVSNSRRYPFPSLRSHSYYRIAAFYRDSKQLTFLGQGGVPEVWNIVTRQRVYPSNPDDFRGASERRLVSTIALSADDAWMAAHGARGSITIWDMQRRGLLLALPEEQIFSGSLAWSPNHELLAAGFFDGSLVIWNIPRIRARLAEIGLDWQNPPLPAARPEPAEATRGPAPVETGRLFALKVTGRP